VRRFNLTYCMEEAPALVLHSQKVDIDFLTKGTGIPLHPIWIDI
jgi:hypothetical protein